MKKLFIALLLVSTGMTQAQTLTLKWTSDSLLRVPESVLYDGTHNVLYVSNIDGAPDGKDGAGFISQLTPDGKIKKLDWVTGLSAPKGMGMFKNNLYVADLTQVAVIDIAAGKIIKTYDVEGSVFLNDITVDKKGDVYISDTRASKIYRLSNGKMEVYLEQEELNGVNGLLAIKDGLFVVNFASGESYMLGSDKKLTAKGKISEGADGIEAVGNGDYIISSWHGEVFYVTASGKVTSLVNTRDAKVGAADIGYNPKTKMVYVPTFFKNTVMAYELSTKVMSK